ncbi:hypothetical protein MIND_00814700 [Mycena indigotica]|uniref:CxC1-like cysteine cluster associated with KDZ transposases domain-containing protein n=1 Tax=Mycena indigotica TaxID=2126181 RepID=A0A8H6SIX1_9AGAR|nr:uncharacterized protein MIND_00814700 [Mycena indigotica]KAF7298675.1 hypothetical protein MIND_00814700 [Mycena indigotica]
MRQSALQSHLQALLAGDVPAAESSTANHGDGEAMDWEDEEEDERVADSEEAPALAPSTPIQVALPTRISNARRSSKASVADAWNTLLPELEAPWAAFHTATYAAPPTHIAASIHHSCEAGCTSSIRSTVQCLYPTHMQTVLIATCSCKSLCAILVENGVFPASPRRPRIGVSIDLLELYRAVFERSCDAITALAHALRTVYLRRGYHVLSEQKSGALSTDPFRQSLTQAVLWSSNLRDRLQSHVNALLTSADNALALETDDNIPSPLGSAEVVATPPTTADAAAPLASPTTTDAAAPLASAPPLPASDATAQRTLQRGRADRILRERCPLCFGGTEWGRPLSVGGDVQLAGDACFSYRHLRSAGDGPTGYHPRFFVPKAKIDAVKVRMEEARKRPVQVTAPDDGCSENWTAANEKKRLADPKRYDASGIFALTCRHSQVLFTCNIDTPGERHHYIIALLEEVLSHLPSEATACQAYDVGCIVDRTLTLYNILDPGVRQRVVFVLNAMHAYGHEWSCQLKYNPRMVVGMGLTDNECIERLWSRIRKLIPITRGQWNSRRIWTIDQYVAFVNEDGFYNLGNWIVRQESKNYAGKFKTARANLIRAGVPISELQTEWEAQRASQTSLRRHAPKRLRRELDKVIALQAQIDLVEKSILEVRQTIAGDATASDAQQLLRQLESTHSELSKQAEALYASLNISKIYPELQGLSPEVAHLLLMMRDLKISIRRKAVGSFQEWETLDQAVSGRREPLGTKLYQATRSTITKRQPALMKALKKFNDYCTEFEQLRPADCHIPVPHPLPTQLSALREDTSLHEDVWITPSEGRPPRWLEDEDVRQGIRSLLTLNRCQEEMVRLAAERRNMHQWLEDEDRILTYTMEHYQEPLLQLYLHERREYLSILRASWGQCLAGPSVRPLRFTGPTAPMPAPLSPRASSPSPSLPPTPQLYSLPTSTQIILEPSDELNDQDIEVAPFDLLPEESEPSVDITVDGSIDAHEALIFESEEGDGLDINYTFKIEVQPPPRQVDLHLFQVLQEYATNNPSIPNAPTSRTIVDTVGRKLHIDSEDLKRLQHRTRWLNNFCLNGVAALVMKKICFL